MYSTQGEMFQTRSREPDQRAKAPLEFVHCDLAGPIEPTAKDGFKYALSFVDDFTGINMVYFLKQKSDTTEATEKYIADVAPYGKSSDYVATTEVSSLVIDLRVS